MRRAGALALLLVAASACVSSQTVTLRPDPKVEPARIGDGVELRIQWTDARPTDVIGHRNSATAARPEIRVDRANVRDAIRAALVRGFEEKGFSISDSPEALPVHFELRELSHEADPAVVASKPKTLAVLNVSVEGRRSQFDRLFTREDSRADLALTSAVRNELMVNGTVDTLLQRVFEDTELLEYLAEHGRYE